MSFHINGWIAQRSGVSAHYARLHQKQKVKWAPGFGMILDGRFQFIEIPTLAMLRRRWCLMLAVNGVLK